jgi:hypothetical protein
MYRLEPTGSETHRAVKRMVIWMRPEMNGGLTSLRISMISIGMYNIPKEPTPTSVRTEKSSTGPTISRIEEKS